MNFLLQGFLETKSLLIFYRIIILYFIMRSNVKWKMTPVIAFELQLAD